MATEPTVCDEIHPAVTHIISWQVAATPHTQENYQVGYYQPTTSLDAVQKFKEWLISEGVTGTPVVFADGHVRTATWFNNNYENPVYHTCEYILRSSGIGGLQVFDGTNASKEFRNLRPYQYAGNSSEGSVIIDYNTPLQRTDVIMRMPFVMALNAIRAIDHVDATIATAYPVVTRTLAAPPPPLTEGLFDLDEKISLIASFKLFVEYQGPDRQKSMWINAKNNMWTYAFGKNEATTDWGYDYKPYQTIEQITDGYYGSTDFKDFFFDSADASQIMEGEYKILTYPWRLATDGNVTYQFPGSKSFNVSLNGESGAIVEFSNFYRNEDYLHNHVWNVKFIRYIALDCEIVTIPPMIPRLTEITSYTETIITPNTGSNKNIYPYVYTYKIHISYKATFAKKVTRNAISTDGPLEGPPEFETLYRQREYPWPGELYQNTPDDITGVKVLSSEDWYAKINLATNMQVPFQDLALQENLYWNPLQEDEKDWTSYSFHYKIRVHYKNIGQHQPEGVATEGWTEWLLWHGAIDQDAPDTLQEFTYGIKKENSFKYKAFGIYEEGKHVEDFEVKIGFDASPTEEGETPNPPIINEIFVIDCSSIGGINPSILNWQADVYKTTYPWPDALIFDQAP